MNMKKKLKSGAMLEVQMASFSDGIKLLEVVAEELKKVNIDIENLSLDKEITNGFIGTFKDLILNAITSTKLRECLDKCFLPCLYNTSKVNDTLFEDNMKAREDYLIICWEVLRYNLAPFLKGIDLSVLQEATTKLTTSIPTQK